MNEAQLRQFADQQLSIVFQPGTPIGVMLTKIVNSSLVIPDTVD